jgi:putative nucleotidyltransferase with HDIG domain
VAKIVSLANDLARLSMCLKAHCVARKLRWKKRRRLFKGSRYTANDTRSAEGERAMISTRGLKQNTARHMFAHIFARRPDALDQAPQGRQASIMRGLCQLLKAHDPHTAAHAEQVARLATRVAQSLGIADADVQIISQAALLHDIGKLAIRAELLAKPELRGHLDEEHIRRHPAIGARLLIALGVDRQIAGLVQSHHERWDGAGYPAGLAGAAIPLGARVVAVADVYDSLTRPRAGLAPLPAAAAGSALLADRGRRLDPSIVVALLDSLCLR